MGKQCILLGIFCVEFLVWLEFKLIPQNTKPIILFCSFMRKSMNMSFNKENTNVHAHENELFHFD